MPKLPPSLLIEREAEARVAAWEAFQSQFRRSFKGNLWRKVDDAALTVFRTVEGEGFKWCRSDDTGPRFSRRTYESEESALLALWRYVEEGEAE